VVVAYNSGELLRRCLAALGSESGEVVVVDNASPQADARAACAEFPHVRLIERATNDGFGTAANAGAAATSGRWILVLNPDAWPLGDALSRLVECAEGRPGLGAAGPLLFDPQGRAQRSTIRPPLSPAALAGWAAFPNGLSGAYGALRKATTLFRGEGTGAAEFLQGAALLVSREAFDAVGGFDESFFMYGEDADLCARLRDAGWGVELCPPARFVHVGGASTEALAEPMYVELLRSWLRLIAKRKPPGEAERARRWLLLALRTRALRSREPQVRAAVAWLSSGRVDELLGDPR
jgi:GT2 family glycosyltransferase